MTGGGRLLLIWGRLCRALLGDKGKPLFTGDKGMCMDQHVPKTRILTDVQRGENDMRTNEYIHV